MNRLNQSENIVLEISKQSVQHNIAAFTRIVGNIHRLCAVVKGNAYGHGIEAIVPLMYEVGVRRFAVYHGEEALRVRQLTDPNVQIILLGYAEDYLWPELVRARIECLLIDSNRIADIDRLLPRDTFALVHLKIDTGMNRFGIKPDEVPTLMKRLDQYPRFKLCGVASHFAESWNLEDSRFTKEQIARFDSVERIVRNHQVKLMYRHMANTAGALCHKESILSFARVGIGLYGYYPQLALKHRFDEEWHLQPVLAFRSKLVSVKHMDQGDRAGYDLSFTAERNTKIALAPVGYSDGFPFAHSDRGSYVLIRGRKARLIGRVNMNAILLDVTDIPDAAVGDRVTLLGRDGDREISVWHWMQWGTPHLYESLSKLRADLPRRTVL